MDQLALLAPLKDIINEYTREKIVAVNIRDDEVLIISDLETKQILYTKNFNEGKKNKDVYLNETRSFPNYNKIFVIAQLNNGYDRSYLISLKDNSILSYDEKNKSKKVDTFDGNGPTSSRYIYDEFKLKRLDVSTGKIEKLNIDFSTAKTIKDFRGESQSSIIHDSRILATSKDDKTLIIRHNNELYIYLESFDEEKKLERIHNLLRIGNDTTGEHHTSNQYYYHYNGEGGVDRFDIKNRNWDIVPGRIYPVGFYQNKLISYETCPTGLSILNLYDDKYNRTFIAEFKYINIKSLVHTNTGTTIYFESENGERSVYILTDNGDISVRNLNILYSEIYIV